MRRSFDNLAKTYFGLERLMFGHHLDSARFHGIATFESHKPQRALVLGDGDGRFSCIALKENPNLLIDSVEQCAKMRIQAQQRIQKLGKTYEKRYRQIAMDARLFSFPDSEYDIVVVQFFLDCFKATDANDLLKSIARTLKSNGKVLYADFSIPQKFPARWIGKGIITFLYLFFKLTTDIQTSRLPALAWPHSLRLTSRQSPLKGLLSSEIRTKSLD